MLARLKTRIYSIINRASKGDRISEVFDYALFILIILNVIVSIFETVNSFYLSYKSFFYTFEAFSITVFTFEYILRIWCCTVDKKYRHPIYGRIKASLAPLALIDLLVIAPFYLSLIIPYDLRFLRLLRIFPLVLIRKVGGYSHSLEVFAHVIKDKKDELMTAFLMSILILVISSSCVYYIERNAQPDLFSSIPATMWWGVVTMTTLGYGDMYPTTVMGKILGAIVACLGITSYAIPIGIISSGFVEEMEKKREKKKCPHCGEKLT